MNKIKDFNCNKMIAKKIVCDLLIHLFLPKWRHIDKTNAVGYGDYIGEK